MASKGRYLKGEIKLPSNFEISPKNWLWVPNGLQYWDTMKEANADEKLINVGLRSRTEIRRERYGDEWVDVVAKLAEEKKLMKDLDLLNQPEPPEAPPANKEPRDGR